MPTTFTRSEELAGGVLGLELLPIDLSHLRILQI